MDCIFCKIVNGEIPSSVVYEDENVKAFLDLSPATNGHTLVIPKKHYENIFDMPEDELLNIEKSSQKVANILKEKLMCKGVTRVQNNGLGQEVKHYHMHIIPRYEEDKLELSTNQDIIVDKEEILSKIKM